MGRTLSGSMPTILDPAKKRDIDYTIDITLPDAQEFHFATSPIVALNGHDYDNYLEKVSEIRQTLEAATDRVAVEIQNKDRDLGWNVANYWDQWRLAEAVIGRKYYEIGATGTRTGVTAWIEMFRGSVQQPNVDDLLVTFDIIPDTTAPGQIVCTRSLAPNCPFIYGDPETCSVAGTLTSCNHHLKSVGGCDGNNNSHHFGGTEHRYNIDPAPPTGGGGGDGGDVDPPCPATDNYVRVRGENARPVPKLAAKVTLDDQLWHPILRRFYPIAALEVVHDQAIWETSGPRGIRGFSSQRHPVIRDTGDAIGTAVEELRKSDHFVVEDGALALEAVRCRAARNTGRNGSVVRITIEAATMAEKIYCWSATPDGPFIVCHNAKINPL